MSINRAEHEIKEKRKRKRASPGANVLSLPVPKPADLPQQPPGRAERSPEDAAWLESQPLRSKVVQHVFDADALAWRLAAPALDEIRSRLREVVGVWSDQAMGPFHKALSVLLNAEPIGAWEVCHHCEGSGVQDGLCRKCRGSGVRIPGL